MVIQNMNFHFFTRIVCHQIAERSFVVEGAVLPVCARCTGIYMGFGVMMLYFLFQKRLYRNEIGSFRRILLTALFFLPISIDGFFSYIGWIESTNFRRLSTGILAGCSLPIFLIFSGNIELEQIEEKQKIISWKEQMMLLGLIGLLGYFLIKEKGWYLGYSVLIVFGVFGLFASIFYILLRQLSQAPKKQLWKLSGVYSFCLMILFGMISF